MDQAWAPHWRVVDDAEGALDLAKTLGTGSNAGPWSLLGSVLRATRDVRGWLLLSADGGATVYLDGKSIWSRDIERLRGRSLDAIPFAIAAGDHKLVIALHHRGGYWAVRARVVDRRDLLAPAGVSMSLPGTDDADRDRLARELLHVQLRTGLTADGYAPRLALSYPGGAPLDLPLDVGVELTLPGRRAIALRLGAVPVGARGAHRLEAELPPLPLDKPDESTRPGRAALHIAVGDAKTTRTLVFDARAPAAIQHAERLRRALPDGHWLDPDAIRATIAQRVARLERLGATRHPTERALARGVEQLEALLTQLEHGEDPLTSPGVLDLALRSDIDGEPQRVRLHVPAGFKASDKRRYPLVVALHGLNGDPTGVMNAFLDTRATGPRSGVDGFVIAPNAHGNAFYRGPGEHAVMRALDWALRTYPIDPLRVSITGVSMGGTGAAGLAFLYADRFAAAAPLCGYQSYFTRRDTSNRPLRPWEKDRMAHWSPTSWADNGRNLPLYLAQGTKDWPLTNGKVLVERYKQLGYRITDEWPDIGHHVWDIVWKDAKMWPWLTRFRRDPSPRHVTLASDQLRYARQSWLAITALARPGHMGRVDAVIAKDGKLTLATGSVEGVSVDRALAGLDASAPVDVAIDGATIGFAGGAAIELHRDGDTWKPGTAPHPAGGKRAGVEGPIRDAFLGPVAFVYGTLDPGTMRANREVAEAFAHRRPGMDVHYTVVSDRELDPSLAATHSLFVVGTARDNLVLRALDPDLPVHADATTLSLGTHRYTGDGVGAIAVFPNPRHPDRYVIAIEATGVRGIWRALSLPELLPDFVVYDDRLAGAAAQQVLGAHASVLAAGFLNDDWSVPADVADPDAAAAP